ncbi:MAG: hypothetical protein HY077_00620 [Elusimicrobia bacterium]|nr:hypothetical protein [Elusimicrobiota bacterium]
MLSLLLALLTLPARAQSAYEIQIYGADTVEKGKTMVELHTNTYPDGPDEPGEVQPDAHAWHETLELTHGFTDWFETGFYTFTSARSGEGWSYAGSHLRPRVMAPHSWGWPVGASLSLEAGYFKPRFQESRWDLEIRPIVDWRRGRFYASINPALERALLLYGEGSRSFQFAPGAKLSWDMTKQVALGLEYYGGIGPVENPSPLSEQQHQLYPVIDLNFSEDWEFNAGAGFGLNRATDSLTLKLILGRRLGTKS